jgi:cell division protein FtsB
MLSPFKIETFEDILRALRERPEWLEELRRLILTEELMALPQKFENFVQKEFKPLKEKVDKIEGDTEVLKQDVSILKQDVEVLKQDVAVLKEDVTVLKEDVAVLKEDVALLKEDVAVLKKDVALLKQDVAVLKEDVTVLKEDGVVLKQDMADLKGDNFERKVRERAPSYFGRLVRRCKLISFEDLAEILESAVEKELIDEKEKDEALNVDVVASGFLKTEKEKKVVVVGEISIKVDRIDVERAYERSKIISRALGLSAIAVVIGKESTEGALEKAKELGVLFI